MTQRRGRLHLAGVERLLGLLDRLVDSGESVIVIEHRHGVMPHAELSAGSATTARQTQPRGWPTRSHA